MLVAIASFPLSAAEETATSESAKPKTVAAPITRLSVDPPKLLLRGPDGPFTLLVDGHATDGQQVDLTHAATYVSSDERIVAVTSRGVAQPRGDGTAVITIEAAGHAVELPVTVEQATTPVDYTFRNDVMPLLSRFGCNASGCHGKAEGQNGFKLSVFGFDAVADYEAITMLGRGRRVFPAEPSQSLLLRKASGRSPHGGGVRIRPETEAYALLLAWLSSGMVLGSDDQPHVTQLVVTPAERVLAMRASQQLRVEAIWSDGRRADVTRWAHFQTNNDAVATVDETGRAQIGDVPGQAAVMASFMGAVDVFQALAPRSESIADYPQVPQQNFIDKLTHDRLKQLNIVPSETCDDATYLRRVYLDVIGVLPTADEARRFLASEHPNRREQLVDELLRRPEFADRWALYWSDLLRVDRQALGHKGAQQYYGWIRRSIAENRPLDSMVRELLTAEGPLAETPPANFYKVVKAPGEMAATLSQVFLGVRIACAECHHHPYDRWSQEDYYAMQACFQQVTLRKGSFGEALVAEGSPVTKHPRSGQIVPPHPLGAAPPALPSENRPQGKPAAKDKPGLAPPEVDRRRELAEWWTAAENPYFARNLANRLAAHFLGRGLVEPVDDVRETNPPTNPALLAALAEEVVRQRYDLRQVIRTITASATYQRATEPNDTNLTDEQNYSRALLRKLPAEVLLDAVTQVTGVPEKFDGTPAGYRAVQLWDSGVRHDFLGLFGRPMRVTACECERNVEPSIAQVLHLLNSPRIQQKLSHAGGTAARLARTIDDDQQLIREVYLTCYSRYPTPAEMAAAARHFEQSAPRRQAATEDLLWSLLNTLEFAFNH